MMVRIFVVAAFLSLAGCATPGVVQVPVPLPCPHPPATVRPHLPISDLTPDASPAATVKAYAVTVEKLKGYAAQLEELLEGYR